MRRVDLRILAATVAAVVCLATALAPSAAVAQTNYYWGGGSGTWDVDTNWYPSSGVNPDGSTNGSPATWVNTNQNVANFGYVNSGGLIGGGGDDGGSYAPPAVVTLQNNVTANSLVFGVPPGDQVSNPYTNYYSINGGTNNSTVTLGDGTNYAKITADLGGGSYTDVNGTHVYGDGTAYQFLNCNVTAVGPGLELANTANSNDPNYSTYINNYNYFTGATTFNSLKVDNAAGVADATGRIFAYFGSGAFPTNTPPVSLGRNAGIAAVGTTSFTTGNITMSDTTPYVSGGFAIGSPSVVQIGAGESSTNSYMGFVQNGAPTVTVGAIAGVAGQYSGVGQSDLVFSSSFGGTGHGTVVLTQPCSYAGATFMQQGAVTTSTGTVPEATVQLGCSNALPVGTDLVFGQQDSSGANGESVGTGGALDMNGWNQSVNTISSWSYGTEHAFGGITNSNSSSTAAHPSVLTITDSAALAGSNATTFNAPIGQLQVGTASQIAGTNNHVALTFSPTGANVSLTLGLAQLTNASGAYINSTVSNTYDGGTIINGGALYAANGGAYWDGTHGTGTAGSTPLNSATGTGAVTVNNGGILGGSASGGAVGMPSTGAVTVMNGGTLIPAGVNYQAAASPAFHVLGNLNLNAGSTVDFTFDNNYSDQVAVGGALTLPTTGSVSLDINNLTTGNIASGTPIFTFGSLANTFNGASLTLSPAGEGYSLFYNSLADAIDLLTPGAALKTWNGYLSSGLWDTATTANFKASGSPVTFSNGDSVTFDDSASNFNVNITAAGVSPTAVTFANSTAHAYTITGGAIGSGAVTVSGGGTVTLNNTNTYAGATQVSNNSTLALGAVSAISSGSPVNLYDTSTLQFNAAGTNSNNITFNAGVAGATASPVISVTGSNNVTLNGTITSELYGLSTSTGFTKQGTGTLTLPFVTSGTGDDDTGPTNIAQGTIAVTGTNGAGAPTQNYTALGSGYIDVQSGAKLYLDGHDAPGQTLQVGFQQNNTSSNTIGSIWLYSASSGATLQASGTSSFEHASVYGVLNYSQTTQTYSPGSINFTTTSAGDTLTLKDYVKQEDPNGSVNGGGNWSNGAPDANKLVTAYVSGPGRVVLQDGAISSSTAFGGQWVVSSGTLQVGPFVGTASVTTPADTTGYTGPLGQPLNALGFHTADGNGSQSVGNADLPNAVTVGPGGLLAVAVDQVNANPNIEPDDEPWYNNQGPMQPNFLRNPVTLSGGSIAATGYEVTFTAANTTYTNARGVQWPGATGVAEGTPDSTPVVARFGGDFTVAAGTSSVLTYDPIGGTGGRTVELMAGSRYLAVQSGADGLASGTTELYTTTWQGTLDVNAGGTTGGAFVIDRVPDSTIPVGNANYGKIGAISVTPGAALNIMNGGVVDYGGVNCLFDGTNGVAVSVGQGAALNLTNVDTTGNVTGRLTIGTLTLAGSTNDWTGVLNVGQTGLIILGSGLDATIRNEIIEGRGASPLGGILTSDTHRVVGYMDVAGGVEVAAVTPGDCNLDGKVDINDLTIVLAHYGATNQGWSTGDLNYDGKVDINDLTIVLAHYSATLSADAAPAFATAVPEPSVLALLAAGFLGLLAYGWKRRG